MSNGTTISYDLNGNMVTKSKPGEVFAYSYDKENRLTQVKKNSTLIAKYLYDGDGGRVQKTSYLVTTKTVSGGFGALTGNQQIVTTPVVTRYVGELYEQTGSVGTAFIFLGSQRVAAVDTNNLTPLYYHTDHLGSTNVISDNNGSVSELIEYDPYGKISRHDGSLANVNRLAKQQFTGKQLDDETGLIYFGARYYDPSLGRFITPDTIVQSPSDPQTLNRYSYCGNNPINRIDPDGHSWWKKFKNFWKKYGDFISPLGRAIVTGDWKNFGYQVLNIATIVVGVLTVDPFMVSAGALSYASRATSHIGGNLADEISRGLGYASMAASAISITNNVTQAFKNFGKASAASKEAGAKIAELSAVTEKTVKVQQQLQGLTTYKNTLDSLKIALAVKPAATVVGAVGGAVWAGKASDWDFKSMLSGAMAGASIGNAFSGVKFGVYQDRLLSASFQGWGESFQANVGIAVPVQVRVYGIPFSRELAINWQYPSGELTNSLQPLTGQVRVWSQLY